MSATSAHEEGLQKTQMQSKRDESFEPRPELLMAARLGHWQQLERLLSQKGDAAAAAPHPVRHVVVDIELEAVLTSGEAVTMAGDSVLHVVASSGDGEEFLKSATAIHGKSSHLLFATNKKGDTPLHCAARAGRGAMVTHLFALASAVISGHGDGEKAKKAFLRTQNEQGETALHEAVRLGDKDLVDRLMAEDPELARVPPADGASPLYLAVSLGLYGIARQLHEKDNALSFSGPDGRTALHAAVLVSEEMTKMLLEWNKDVIKQAERSTGNTALHFAASWERADGPITKLLFSIWHTNRRDRSSKRREEGNQNYLYMEQIINLLLAADPSLAYQPDNNGSFPIHVAAIASRVNAVYTLLHGRYDCAELRDANGMTFLHVAVAEESRSVVRVACRWFSFRSKMFGSLILNMQDNDGNTALHLAVQVGDQYMFNNLIANRLVKLNLTNNKGQTPLDISWDKLRTRHRSLERIGIHGLLRQAGATCGTYRRDSVDKKKRLSETEEKEKAKKITEANLTVGLGSTLIATVAFAAAFTLPGGYRADDHENGGTPTLAGHYAFDAFIIADTLAFILAILSIAFLISAEVVPMEILGRLISLGSAKMLMASSARSLCAAFAFGLYVQLAPVARTTAIASCAITALALLDTAWSVMRLMPTVLPLAERQRCVISSWGKGRKAACAILRELLSQFWPYIVIAGLCFRIKGVH